MAKVEKTLASNTTKVKDVKKSNKAKSKKGKPANAQPKRSRIKETMSELKKVDWPSFGETMKQTGMVISVVLIFTLVVLGIDNLLSLLFGLIVK